MDPSMTTLSRWEMNCIRIRVNFFHWMLDMYEKYLKTYLAIISFFMMLSLLKRRRVELKHGMRVWVFIKVVQKTVMHGKRKIYG